MLMRITHDPIDWPTVITDLVRGGFTVPKIASKIGIPPSTIKGWRNSQTEPHHGSGERLVILWCNATQKSRDSIPTKYRPRKPTASRRTSWIQLTLIEGNEIHNCDHTCKIC